MYYVSVLPDGKVLNLYDSLDLEVETPKFQISDTEAHAIITSGNHNLWQYLDGKIVDYVPPPEPLEQPALPGTKTSADEDA